MSLSFFETEVLIGQELLNEPGITSLQASPPPQHWGFKDTPLWLPLPFNMDFYIVLRSSRPWGKHFLLSYIPYYVWYLLMMAP